MKHYPWYHPCMTRFFSCKQFGFISSEYSSRWSVNLLRRIDISNMSWILRDVTSCWRDLSHTTFSDRHDGSFLVSHWSQGVRQNIRVWFFMVIARIFLFCHTRRYRVPNNWNGAWRNFDCLGTFRKIIGNCCQWYLLESVKKGYIPIHDRLPQHIHAHPDLWTFHNLVIWQAYHWEKSLRDGGQNDGIWSDDISGRNIWQIMSHWILAGLLVRMGVGWKKGVPIETTIAAIHPGWCLGLVG